MAELEERLAGQVQERLAGQRAELEERLGARCNELEERLAAQRDEIARLRAERAEAVPASPLILPADLRQPGGHAAAGGPDRRLLGRPTSRRDLLRLGGAAAAAGVAAGLIESRAAHAAPVPTGGGFILGQANDAGATTALTATSGSTPSPILDVAQPNRGIGMHASASGSAAGNAGIQGDGTSLATGVRGTSDGGVGVFGFASSTGTGVYGQSLGGGYGVVAVSDPGTAPFGGIDLFLNGGGRLQQRQQDAVWPPTSGAYYAGEMIRDKNNDLWLCMTSGTNGIPNTWRKVAALAPGSALGGSVNLLPVATRLLDTRGGAPVAYHGTIPFLAAGVGAIPAGAAAVFGHLVAALRPGVDPGDGSSAICWPAGQPRPAAVNLVYNGGDLKGAYTGTLALVAVGAGGMINLYSQPIAPGVAIDYIFDAAGFVV
jgi:hypothetical protein